MPMLKEKVKLYLVISGKADKTDLQLELEQNIQALFESAEPNQSVRCKFGA